MFVLRSYNLPLAQSSFASGRSPERVVERRKDGLKPRRRQACEVLYDDGNEMETDNESAGPKMLWGVIGRRTLRITRSQEINGGTTKTIRKANRCFTFYSKP